MKRKNLIIYIGLFLIFILLIVGFSTLYNPVLCKGEETCIVEKQVRKMKFDKKTKYEFISIENSKLSKIEGLNNQENLKNLDLAGNQISKIEGLDDLTNLNTLDLSNNKISKIEGVENLNKLSYIYLQGNPIDVIENIENVDYSGNFIWYLPAEITSITSESYRFLKENPNVEVYFVEKDSNIHQAVSNKTIDDLQVV